MKHKSNFRPRNLKKYRGNHKNITYRSSWEHKFMKWLDHNDKVLEWNSEEIIIPYRSPIDNKLHRYFPDFWLKYVNKNNQIEERVVEIKPRSQTSPPKKSSKRYLKEVMTWGVNQAKWEACIQVCKTKGWKFEIFTEKHLWGLIEGYK